MGRHPLRPSSPVTYRAAASLPRWDRDPAVLGLRQQLQVMLLATGATPDWASLVVEGPVEVPGVRGGTWYEWRASVSVEGDLDDVADDAALLLRPLGETQPFALLG